MIRSLFVLAAACMLVSSAVAQSNELRFDVVSIKPLGPAGGPMPFSGELIHQGGRFRDPGTTLRVIIDMAYDVEDLGLKIVGLPKWAEAAAYAIDAAAGPDYPAVLSVNQNKENVKAMIRSMLADRFQLKIRREERRTQVLILQAAKGGAKLRPATAPVPPEKEGLSHWSVGDRRVWIGGDKVTMAQVAASLSLTMKQRVVDRTGLTGHYTFLERWDAPPRADGSFPPYTLGPDGQAQLLSMLEQSLGLVLKPETAPAEYWVVDQVEMPGEN